MLVLRSALLLTREHQSLGETESVLGMFWQTFLIQAPSIPAAVIGFIAWVRGLERQTLQGWREQSDQDTPNSNPSERWPRLLATPLLLAWVLLLCSTVARLVTHELSESLRMQPDIHLGTPFSSPPHVLTSAGALIVRMASVTAATALAARLLYLPSVEGGVVPWCLTIAMGLVAFEQAVQILVILLQPLDFVARLTWWRWQAGLTLLYVAISYAAILSLRYPKQSPS